MQTHWSPEDVNEFREAFAAERRKQGVIQRDIAAELSCTVNTITNFERGNTTPSVYRLNKLSKIYERWQARDCEPASGTEEAEVKLMDQIWSDVASDMEGMAPYIRNPRVPDSLKAERLGHLIRCFQDALKRRQDT